METPTGLLNQLRSFGMVRRWLLLLSVSILLLVATTSLASSEATIISQAEVSPPQGNGNSQPLALTGPQGDLGVNDFATSTVQGFGDRQNQVAWSMKWWPAKETLYVGTNRSWMCWSFASIINTFALLASFYPPNDPDVQCTPDSRDLPLQAEIWAWHGPTDTWEMVFRSPADVPIPNDPQGRFVARDIGFRTMNLFIEPDGTEALYVGATNAKPMYEDRDTPNLELPPPRIYRSTEGTAGSFEPIPQDPGTVMGDLPKSSFRSLVTYNDKLYVIHSTAQGNGKIYESANPKEGNDAWRQVSPDDPDLRSFELQPFNDYLYVGALDLVLGYAVLKTDATGEPPYEFIPVVEKAGYLRPSPSRAVVSMHVFNDKLYVGTDNPAEIIRINKDDDWDLIIGIPREAPEDQGGWKYPIGGLGEGFNFPLNDHIWRMQEHDGRLYIGTYDSSVTQRTCQERDDVLRPFMGMDIYSTSDGLHFETITTDGFGDKNHFDPNVSDWPFNVFEIGARTFQSTPYGLFMGTANNYYGLNIYQGFPRNIEVELDPPARFVGSAHPDGNLLIWDELEGSTLFSIFRSEFTEIQTGPPGSGTNPIGCNQPELSLDELPLGVTQALLDALDDPRLVRTLTRNPEFPEAAAALGLNITDGFENDDPLKRQFLGELLANGILVMELLNNESILDAVLATAGLTAEEFFRDLQVPTPSVVDVPDVHEKIGETTDTFFIDTTRVEDVTYSYYIIAEDESTDRTSGKSNLVTLPLADQVTDKFTDLTATRAVIGLELTEPLLGQFNLSMKGHTAIHIDVDTIGTASDTDGDGFDQVSMQIVTMELVGYHPELGNVFMRVKGSSPGELEETTNNIPGVLELAPFVDIEGASAIGFFDLSVEIELPDLGIRLSEGIALRLEAEITHLIPGTGDPYLSIRSVIDPVGLGDTPSVRLVHAGLTGMPLPQLEGSCGDQNEDGRVDVADAIIDAQIFTSLIDPNTVNAVFSDLNSDGFVDLFDTIAILNHIANLTLPETCGPLGAEFIS